MTHTPGPWTFSDEYVIAKETVIADPYCMATRGQSDEGEMEANASLIAAAPDMLEALEEVASYLDKEDSESLVETVNEAITKARGSHD